MAEPAAWRKWLGTGIDYFTYSNPVGVIANPIAEMTTGKSLGTWIAGDSHLDVGKGDKNLVTSLIKDPEKREKWKDWDIMTNVMGMEDSNVNATGRMTSYLEGLSAEQIERAEQIRAELEKDGRPVMDEEVLAMEDSLRKAEQIATEAKILAQTGMPEEQYRKATQDIDRKLSGTLSSASSRGSLHNMIGDLYGGATQAQLGVDAMDASMRRDAQNQWLASETNVATQMNNLASAKGRAESWNELQPYMEKLAEYQALMGASDANQYNAMYFQYLQQQNQNQMALDALAYGTKFGVDAGKAFATGGMA